MFPAELSPSELIGPIEASHEVRAVAVSNLSASATIEGTSGKMGNSTDTALLLGLRAWADAVLVGARTVEAEDYQGPSSTPIAVLSRSLSLDPAARFFHSATLAPLILSPARTLADSALKQRREALESAGAQLVSTDDGSPKSVLASLRKLGFARISLEGGPRIYSLFLQEGLVDKLHLTLDPLIQGGVSTHLFDSRTPFLRPLELEHLAATADSTLFLRYRVRNDHIPSHRN